MTFNGTIMQNGAVERTNMTLAERMRCIRLNAGLPKNF